MAINPVDSVKMQPLSGEVIQSVPLQVPANASIAALRAVVEAPSKAIVARTAGWTAALDGDEGEFYWDAASALADDGGSSIKPTVAGGTGRFRRLFRPGASVSVRSFGAVGDGVTDDSVAVQAATTYAVANKRTLLFPGGTYLCNTSVFVAGPITILGEGKGVTILKSTATKNFFTASVNINAGAVYIGNLTYTGPAATSGHFVWSASAAGCSDSTLERVQVTAGGLVDGTTTFASITRLLSCDSTSANTYLNPVAINNNGDFIATGNTLSIGGSSTASAAFSYQNAAGGNANILIDGNRVVNYGTFFATTGVVGGTADIIFRNNYFLSTAPAASSFFASPYSNPNTLSVSIIGNVVAVGTPPANGVIYDGNTAGAATRWNISNNYISHTATSGSLWLINVSPGPGTKYITSNRLVGGGTSANLITVVAGGGITRMGRNFYSGSANVFTGTLNSSTMSWDTPFLDAQDFGAVGNGSTDDSVAIQAAVNAGVLAYLPIRMAPGLYKVSVPITATIQTNQSFKLFADTLSSGSGGVAFQTSSSTADILTITVSGGSIDMSVDIDGVGFGASVTRTAGAYVHVIPSAGSSKVRINNCNFEAAFQCINLSGAFGAFITNCRFANFVSIGVKILATSLNSGLAILGNYFQSAAASPVGISIDAVSSGVIDVNTFSFGGSTGAFSIATTAAITGLTIGPANAHVTGGSFARYSLFSLANIVLPVERQNATVTQTTGTASGSNFVSTAAAATYTKSFLLAAGIEIKAANCVLPAFGVAVNTITAAGFNYQIIASTNAAQTIDWEAHGVINSA